MTHFQILQLSRTSPQDVICAARDWVELFEARDPTASERLNFHKWVRRPQHERAFATESAFRSRLREIPERARRELISELAALTSPRRLPMGHLWTRYSWAAVAAGILFVVGALWMGFPDRHYVTGVGEKLALQLIDGTHVELSPQTELKWLGADQCDRRIRLVRGEALFSVRDNPQCPFRVFVGRGTIEVLGTQFDVHQDKSGEERVSVLEGLVRLRGESGATRWELDLAAGEQATWAAGSPRTRRLVGALSPTAWREDRLEFDDQPLAQVVNDLQRYTTTPIEIVDQRLLSKHVTAVLLVDESHIRGAVRRLGQWPGIAVKDTGRSLVLSSR